MSRLLKGKEVAEAINARSEKTVNELKEKGIEVTLATIRVGEKPDDISYERSACKKAESLNISVKNYVFPEDIDAESFYEAVRNISNDEQIHGILMFRPLPKHIDDETARNLIDCRKDIDGCTDGSLAGLMANRKKGFVPCTAQAAVEILDHYGIEVAGKNVTVIGRSLVIGKPVALLLTNRNATVTICHTRTQNMAEISRKADIVIAATGKMESFGKDYFSENQSVIDVGMTYNSDKQKFCGDVVFDEVSEVVENITPVPGGVGSVTTAVLLSHVVEAALNTVG